MPINCDNTKFSNTSKTKTERYKRHFYLQYEMIDRLVGYETSFIASLFIFSLSTE